MRCMQDSGYEVLGVCNPPCMLYSVCAVISVNLSSRHGEMERNDIMLCSWVVVELRTRRRKMSRDGENHDENP
jgi:hypothetical protein